MKHLYISLTIFFFTSLSQAGNSFTCPTVTVLNQSFCVNSNPTVANLLPSDALWYTSNDPSAVALSNTAALKNNTVYYSGDLAGTCTTRPTVSVTLTSQVSAGNDKFTEICDSETQTLFPALYSIDNYYKGMLDSGVPWNGTFSPTARQMSENYQASDIDGYKDFTTTYTVGPVGCQDSVDLTLRVHELKKAGDDTNIVLFADDAPVNLFDYLEGDPSNGGSWSVLGDGTFDPSQDQPGDYTYTVEGCVGSDSSIASVSIRPAVAPGCPKVTDISQSFCRSSWPGNKVKFLVAADNGGGVAWYSDNTSTVALDPETLLVDGGIYYAGTLDGGCVGTRTAVTVDILFAPNAGSTSNITLDSNGPTVDLRDLINQTDPSWPVDNGGYMVPNTKAGGTSFTPSIDGTWTGNKQTRHWVTGTSQCPTDNTFVNITINPAPKTSHRLYYLGTNEQDAEKYFNYHQPSSQDAGLKVNIWIDIPLEIGSVYKINDKGTFKYYYVNNVYEAPDMTPNLTYTGDISIELTNIVVTVADNTDPEQPTSMPVLEYVAYSNPVLSNENYVHTRTPRVEVTDFNEITSSKDIIESVSYFDGLGRAKQNIALKAGGDQEDIITVVDYDAFGRQSKDYLPYASSTGNGQIHLDALLETQTFYSTSKYENTPNPYSEKVFENSPINRVTKQAAPGSDWAIGSGHEIGFNYQTNAIDEVRLFNVIFSGGDYRQPTLGESGYYNAGELYKTITYDEEHSNTKNHSTEEFKDKQGRVVLKRTYADFLNEIAVAHDTYYVYDDYGNLTYVLPPKMEGSVSAINILQTNLPELGYQYEYDTRNRLVEKQIPGKAREYIVYNSLDQPVLTQDANLRKYNQWLYTKYDAHGRVVETGIYSHGSLQDQFQMQEVLNSYYETTSNDRFEAKSGLAYTNYSFPVAGLEVLTQNFYDNYSFDLAGLVIPSSLANGTTIEKNKVQGLNTGSKVKVLDTQNWITSTVGYDKNGRAIWSASVNPYMETTDISESILDFSGNVLNQISVHRKVGDADIIIVDTFNYDQMNRLLSHLEKINEQEDQLINYNYYDELGQLSGKDVGGALSLGPDSDSTSFKDLVGLSIGENNLITKTETADNWGNAGLATENLISGDGFMEGVLNTNSIRVMMGLSKDNPNAHYNTIDYALYTYNNKLMVYENGSNKGTFQNYVAGDTLRVERVGKSIYYKQNENILFISPVSDSVNLIGDMSFYTAGSTIGSVSLKPLGNAVSSYSPLQEIGYTYNIRGWLTKINDPSNLGEDLFGFEINYNKPKIAGSKALFNGNISETHWNSLSENLTSNPVSKQYLYDYDALNRITGAIDNTGNYNLYGISYDRNGNIMTLNRKGNIDSNISSFGDMDILQYQYKGNQLRYIIESGNTDFGFKKGVFMANYVFDRNGNLTIDVSKDINRIQYNHLNLPTKVDISMASINYIYDANGVKQKKIVVDRRNNVNDSTDYAGNYIYENGNLRQFSQPEGYIEPDGSGGFQYVYSFLDHLGNVRLNYSDLNGNGSIDPATEIIQEKNYYPFGLEHKGYNNVIVGSENNYFNFNGKELDESLGLNVIEMDWRQYDPALGRFNVVDPLAEERDWLSPYNFAQNNPILRVDPTGLLDDYGIDNETGNISLIKKTDDNTDTLYAGTGEGENFVKDESKGSVTINKESDGTSILSQLDVSNTKVEQYNDYGTIKDRNVNIAVTDESNKNDAFKVFKFAADNSKVEFSLGKINYQGLGTNYQIGTYHDRNLSPGVRNSEMGNVLGLIHSHPNQPTKKDRNESIGVDTGVSTRFLSLYGADKPYRIYFPNLQTTEKLSLPKESFLRGSVVRKGKSSLKF